jgi:hypothetical protein
METNDIISIVGIISSIIGLLFIIMFISTFFTIGKIHNELVMIKKILIGWSGETGNGITYTCKSCKKSYNGQQPTCPHCGDVKTYK